MVSTAIRHLVGSLVTLSGGLPGPDLNMAQCHTPVTWSPLTLRESGSVDIRVTRARGVGMTEQLAASAIRRRSLMMPSWLRNLSLSQDQWEPLEGIEVKSRDAIGFAV